MPRQRSIVFIIPALFVCTLAMVGCATAKGGTQAEKRTYTLQMRDEALADLYEQRPEARQKIENAAGYGAFSAIGTNLIFVTTGGGYGVVHNKKTGADTFMKMGEIGVGLGIGVTDFRAVFVFYDQNTINKFVTEGWEWGAQAQAAAQAGDQGGSATGAGTLNSGMEIYQFTKNGIALSVSVSGTRYWKDALLNE